MIQLTTNANLFWSQISEDNPTIIYGTGEHGETFARMLKNANIPFGCFLDIQADINNPKTLLGKEIFHPANVMQKYPQKKYSIIITALAMLDCIREIEASIENAVVLIPPVILNNLGFDYLLGYCRHKLIKNENFSIIANNCLGGVFYGITNCELMSPTINIIIEPEDYVKFCSNLKHYLSIEPEFVNFSYWRYNKYHPIGKLDDIKVHFIGYKTFEEAFDAWERRKKRVNYDNLFMIFDSTHYQPTVKQFKDFLKIPYGKKLIFQKDIAYPIEHSIITSKGYHPFEQEHIIEEYFDLTGWLNGDVEY